MVIAGATGYDRSMGQRDEQSVRKDKHDFTLCLIGFPTGYFHRRVGFL